MIRVGHWGTAARWLASSSANSHTIRASETVGLVLRRCRILEDGIFALDTLSLYCAAVRRPPSDLERVVYLSSLQHHV